MLSQEQKDQFNKLMDYRDEICNSMFHIERILQTYFPEEYDTAYQHYIPQIMTALDDNDKWLPRGEINMQYTIKRILDKISNDDTVGVYKFTK